MRLMNGKRQKTRPEQLGLALSAAGRGEALSAVERGTEPFAAKHLNESPADTERLMEEVCERENCKQALRRVKANRGAPGVDGMSVRELEAHLKQHWPAIRDQLLNGTYHPQPVRRVEIDKPDGSGVRKLGIPTVLDRLIQQMALQVLQKRWDPTFSDHSYAFRPKRSAHQAVARAQQYIAEGCCWVVDLDLEKFFDQPSQCPPQEPTFRSKVSSFSLPALSLRSAASVAGLSGKRYNFVRASRASAIVPLWMRS